MNGVSSAELLWSWCGYIPPAKGKNPREELDSLDFTYLFINACITAVYLFHFHQYVSVATNINWEMDQIGVLNTIGSTLGAMGIYDLVYVPWHNAMHWKALYPWVHKHHHRQLAPTRGTIDGINTHPLEFLVG